MSDNPINSVGSGVPQVGQEAPIPREEASPQITVADNDRYIDGGGRAVSGEASSQVPQEIRLQAGAINLLLQSRYQNSDMKVRIEQVGGELFYVLYGLEKSDGGKEEGQRTFVKWALLNPLVMKDVKGADVVIVPEFGANGMIVPFPYGWAAFYTRKNGDPEPYLDVMMQDWSRKDWFFLYVPYRSHSESGLSRREFILKKFEEEWPKVLEAKVKKPYVGMQIVSADGSGSIPLLVAHPIDVVMPQAPKLPVGSHNGGAKSPFEGGSPALEGIEKKDRGSEPGKGLDRLGSPDLPKEFPSGVELSIALDTSGSMGEDVPKYWSYLKGKLEEVPSIFRFFVKVSLVIEDKDGAKVLLPPTRMTSGGMEDLKNAIEGIRFSGGTERYNKAIEGAVKLVGLDKPNPADGVMRGVIVVTDEEGLNTAKITQLAPGIEFITEDTYDALKAKVESSLNKDNEKIASYRKAFYQQLRRQGYSREVASNVTTRVFAFVSETGAEPIKQGIHYKDAAEKISKLAAAFQSEGGLEVFLNGLNEFLADHQKDDGLEAVSALAIGVVTLIPPGQRKVMFAKLEGMIFSDVDHELKRAAVSALGIMARDKTPGAVEALTRIEARARRLSMEDRLLGQIRSELAFSVDYSDRARSYLEQLQLNPNSVIVEDIVSCGFNPYTVDALMFIIEFSSDTLIVSTAIIRLRDLVKMAVANDIYDPANPVDADRSIEKLSEMISIGLIANKSELEGLIADFENYKAMVAKRSAAGSVGVQGPKTKMEELEGTDVISGDDIILADLVKKHKFTMIVVWDEYCPHCKNLMDKLQVLKGLYDIGVVGLHPPSTGKEEIRKIFKGHGYDFPTIGVEMAELPVISIPTTIVVGPALDIERRIHGDIGQQELKGLIEELILEE